MATVVVAECEVRGGREHSLPNIIDGYRLLLQIACHHAELGDAQACYQVSLLLPNQQPL
jgi:hypothetical protein